MKQLLQNFKTGEIALRDVPHPSTGRGEVLIRNVTSLVSVGTERQMVDLGRDSLLAKARKRPDLVRQVLRKVSTDGIVPTIRSASGRLDSEVSLGYSCCGVVEAIGADVRDLTIGDRVAAAGAGYATHSEMVSVPWRLVSKLPTDVTFEEGCFVTLGAIAMQGVRSAGVQLGERIVVVGLGLLGQLTVQLLVSAGCRVLGVDLDPWKVELALQHGAARAVLANEAKTAVAAFTEGRGADGVIIAAATARNDAVELAAEVARDRAVVTIVGMVKMDVPRRSFYNKELQLRMSRSYGPGRYDPRYEEGGVDYPIGYVRWTEQRNMEEFLHQLGLGRVRVDNLVTHRLSLDTLVEGYKQVTSTKNEEATLGVVVQYDGRSTSRTEMLSSLVRLRPQRVVSDRIVVGVIGGGSFARTTILPILRKHKHVRLRTIATRRGASAFDSGQRGRFEQITTNPDDVMNDKSIDAVVIATTHESHAALAAQALDSGKAVFVEKPMALNVEELDHLTECWQRGNQVLTVGFNRRFAKLVNLVKQQIGSNNSIALVYRVNAGAIPGNHWIHDLNVGGGRIVGEMCHFVDTCQFFCESLPSRVWATAACLPDSDIGDTVACTLRFLNGSVVNLAYFCNGDRLLPKERIEIFWAGKAAIIDDFRRVTFFENGTKKSRTLSVQDKGHKEEINRFLTAVKDGGPMPIPMESLVMTTKATFALESSLRTGDVVDVR